MMHIPLTSGAGNEPEVVVSVAATSNLTSTNNSQESKLNMTGDMFDSDSGPVMFMSDNRTAAITDIGLVIVCILFLTCLLLILVLLPSIRRNKLRNFVFLSLVIIVGYSIPMATMKNTWMVGELELVSVPYDSMFKNQFTGLIRVEIGLKTMNVSLVGNVTSSDYLSQLESENVNTTNGGQDERGRTKLVHYNERFSFETPDDMQLEHWNALKRGLPYPILSVSEFFSQDADGFNWARQIRQAGYYTSLLLCAAFAFWLVTVLIMCVLPAYFLVMLRATCLLCAVSHLNYALYAPALLSSTIVISGEKLLISLNHMVIVGAICSIIAYYFAYYFSSLFELEGTDQSMTIMDSEDYLKDKQALGKPTKPSKLLPLSLKIAKLGKQPTNSVIIPIDDIERKFAIGSKPK